MGPSVSTTGDGEQSDARGADLWDDLLRGNREHAARTATAAAAGATRPAKLPARRLFVLTCMDARVDPLPILGLRPGDAHVVRNAGGRVTDDVVRSLLLSSALLGTRHAVVVHHTDCGLQATGDAHVLAQLRARGVDVGDLAIGTFADLDGSVRDDVAALAAEPLVGTELSVRGFVYDVRTHALRPVDDA